MRLGRPGPNIPGSMAPAEAGPFCCTIRGIEDIRTRLFRLLPVSCIPPTMYTYGGPWTPANNGLTRGA